MAQRVKGLAAKPDDLDLIPGTYLVEGGNGLQRVVLISHEHRGRHALPPPLNK